MVSNEELAEQEPGPSPHLSSPSVLSGIRVAQNRLSLHFTGAQAKEKGRLEGCENSRAGTSQAARCKGGLQPLAPTTFSLALSFRVA